MGARERVPHSALHATNGENLNRLIGIEYGFHVTLVVAAGAVACFLVRAGQAMLPRPGLGKAPAPTDSGGSNAPVRPVSARAP